MRHYAIAALLAGLSSPALAVPYMATLTASGDYNYANTDAGRTLPTDWRAPVVASINAAAGDATYFGWATLSYVLDIPTVPTGVRPYTLSVGGSVEGTITTGGQSQVFAEIQPQTVFYGPESFDLALALDDLSGIGAFTERTITGTEAYAGFQASGLSQDVLDVLQSLVGFNPADFDSNFGDNLFIFIDTDTETAGTVHLAFNSPLTATINGFSLENIDSITGSYSGQLRLMTELDETEVPEPASLALLATGLAGLGMASRRRRLPEGR